MVVSYLEAYRMKNGGQISWDQYIENLFARCRGVEHEDDNKQYGHWNLRYGDPFGYSIWRWCKTVPQMKDSTSFEDVFKTYRRASLNDVKQKLEALPKEYEQGIRKSQDYLALQDRRADVLLFCLEKRDFPYESYFEDEANSVNPEKDPETFMALEESHFRQIFPRKNGTATGSGNDSRQGQFIKPKLRESNNRQDMLDRAARFDEGGSHPVDW